MAKSAGPLASIVGAHQDIDISQIVESAHNPNRQTKYIFSKLVESIRKHGFIQPIIVREKGDKYEVIGGAHRLRAAQSLKMAKLPAINLGKVGDAEAASMLIVLNETHGSADQDEMAALIQFINESGGEEALQVLPYTESELADLLDDDSGDEMDGADDDEAEEAPPDTKEAKIRPADVAALFELEGMRQSDLKLLCLAIRKWRQRTDPATPAWTRLMNVLKNDR